MARVTNSLYVKGIKLGDSADPCIDLSVLKFPRFEHFDIEYSTGNSCSFLGNGFATRELDGVRHNIRSS